MTLEGSSNEDRFNKRDFIFCVKKNKLFTLRSITLSQPASEKLSYGSPHAAPALLTKKSIPSSCSDNFFESSVIPSILLMSHGMGMHS